MKEFRALVVDDDESIRRQALAIGARHSNMQVFVAASLEQAEAVMLEQFLHVAVVDLQLVKGGTKDIGGQICLRRLKEIRPSCQRILLTEQFAKYRKELFRLLDPRDALISGALDKRSFDKSFVTLLRDLARGWQTAPVTVSGLDVAYAALHKKRIVSATTVGGSRAAASKEELEYVLSTAFGQAIAADGDEAAKKSPPPPRELRCCAMLEGGKSRAVVALFQLVDEGNESGLLTAVKIGPRQDAIEELRRYHEYVRFRVSLHRRVELLSASLGDTIAAVCYSFAGHAPNRIDDLQTLFDRGSVEALARIDQLFGPGAAEWLGDQHTYEDEGEFFDAAYGLDPISLEDQVREFAARVADSHGGRVAGDHLVLEGGKVPLPVNLGRGRFRDPYESCVVHGDLNASNVLVDDEGHVLLIDFRHTTRGPRSLDFCGLQTSVRLSVPALEDGRERSPLAQFRSEQELWGKPWHFEDLPSRAGATSPYWYQVSVHLLRHAYRCLPQLDPKEHAVTALLYALRFVRVHQLGDEARFRLLLWMGALVEVIES